MNEAQKNWLTGHTLGELCVLLTDLYYQQNNLHTTARVKQAGVTQVMVAQHILHRIVMDS
jgi:hypothetical protein